MRAWTRRSVLACVLWPVSLLFGAIAGLRRTLYRTGILTATQVQAPVIIVGNVYVGGTGKTPFVIWLIEALRAAGYTPGVISRGYGAQGHVPQSVNADSDPAQAGDEPVLIASRAKCPVMVCRKRSAAAQALLAAHPDVDVIVADDGLQHYALGRDVEIVLFDARGAGNGWLLPAGPLREPLSRPRDFTVLNAPQLPAGFAPEAWGMHLAGEEAYKLGDGSQHIDLCTLVPVTGVMVGGAGMRRQARITAAAGIGNPRRFFSMLRSAGLVFDELPLPDHYDFAVNPFAGVEADIILITEKDAVKCVRIEILKNDPRLWVVPVAARVDGALAEQIVEKLRGHPTAGHPGLPHLQGPA